MMDADKYCGECGEDDCDCQLEKLQAQIAALLVAIEAKDAALDSLVSWVDDWAETSDTDFTRIETKVNAARALSTSAELLESRDRKRDAKLLRVITQRIQPQDSYQDEYFKAKVHSYNIVNELIKQRESGDWQPLLDGE